MTDKGSKELLPVAANLVKMLHAEKMNLRVYLFL